MIKVDWFNRFDANGASKFERIVQSWDTANKATELSNYSVCTTWGIIDKKTYLLHVLRKGMEYPELKRAVREQRKIFDASVVLIENKASGTQLLQELINDGLYAATAYEPEGDKIMRMHAQTAMIENGFVHLPAYLTKGALFFCLGLSALVYAVHRYSRRKFTIISAGISTVRVLQGAQHDRILELIKQHRRETLRAFAVIDFSKPPLEELNKITWLKDQGRYQR
jgi:predicted phage terminase large subunit-like protein